MILKNIVCHLYYCKIDFKLKYIWEKDVFNEMPCKKSLISNIIYGRRHSKRINNSHISWDPHVRIGRLSAVPNMCLPVGSLHVRECYRVGKPVGRRVQFKLPLSSNTLFALKRTFVISSYPLFIYQLHHRFKMVKPLSEKQ